METIRVTRREDQDASQAAAEAAKAAGTKLAGNLRWCGELCPSYRTVPTADGRVVQVLEPAR